ncbi:MAG: hypothetical protein KatS3mg101_0835 [Patescibacteria group bacterium]|nr:MAG: hypothetical protein KatS3mg101_0835 [Patescibacteria group bacterium]
MGFALVQAQLIENSAMTEILQATVQYCEMSCRNIMDGNTVIIIGGSGNVDATQSCTINDASCLFKSSFQTSIADIINNTATQYSKVFSGLSLDVNAAEQITFLNTKIVNKITQLLAATCKNESENIKDNNTYILVNHNGDLDLGQQGEVSNITCNSVNTAKAAASSSISNKASQSSTYVSLLAAGVALIAVIIAVVVLLVIIVPMFKKGGSKNPNANVSINK